MPGAPRLGRREVRPGPGKLATGSRLGGFRVARRIGDRHHGRPQLACPGISGRRLSVERQVEDLAERLARVLRRREALPFARAQEQRLAVRRKCDDRAELPALTAGRIVPQQLRALEPRAFGVSDELRPRQRKPAPAIRRWLGIGQIHQVIAGECRRQLHVEQSALLRHDHPRRAGDRLLCTAFHVDEPDTPRLLGDDRGCRSREEVHRPRIIEPGDRAGGEGRIGR